ncbi:MAG: hypothetical protein ACK2VA_17210 [Anaerolineae bacterium]
MGIEFDWHVSDEQGQEETVAHIGRRKRRGPPRWIWVVAAIVLLAAGSGAYLFLRQRYERAQQVLTFQIQGIVDLEARAYAQGDAELFLEQQDRSATGWYQRQVARVDRGCLRSPSTRYRGSVSRARCEPVLPATVQDVQLRGSIAWVEVTEGDPLVRRVRFYRQTDLGWKQTAPQASFWGTAIEVRYGENLVFRYRRRDRPYVQPAVERIVDAYDRTCAVFSCSSAEPIEVRFVEDMPRLQTPQLQNDVLVLPSPWLAGIPTDGSDEAPYVTDYAYLIADELAATHLQAAAGRSLTPFEVAMVGEYAAWQSTGTRGHAPIVDRLVARQGEAALATILTSLQDVGSLNLLMVQWLGLSASDEPSAYFETLVNIEQEALAAGRKETFLLLQDEVAPGWQSAQEALFNATQATDASIEPVNVQAVDVSGNVARVTLDRPTALVDANPLAPRGQTLFFRREGGDWKHTSPWYA